MANDENHLPGEATANGGAATLLLPLQTRALEAAANTIIITDAAGKMLWVNRAAVVNYGYAYQELIGANPRLFRSGRHDGDFYRDLWETVLDGRVWHGTVVNLTKSGELIHEEMTITPVIETDGEISHFIAIKQNITERKAIEEALHLREFAVDRISDAVLLARPDGKLIYVNDAACALLDYSSSELLALSVDAIDPGAAQEGWPAHWEALCEAGDYTIETEHRTRDGKLLPVDASVNHLTFEGSEYYCSIVRDITERKRTGEDLRVAKERAVAANEAKSQFLANMSHELRTPLNGVLGYAQILERSTGLDQRQLEAVQVIKSSGEHLLGLINDVLDLSKVEAAKIELEPTNFRLDAFLSSIEKAFVPRASEKGIIFLQTLDGDGRGMVRADARRLRQVLFNLLGNAIKFTDTGEVAFSVQRRGAYTRFEIADSGPGIAAADLEAIFEPFHQVGNHERRAKGTGLGLTISRTLVRLMGGELTVESEPGKGSCFSLTLELPATEEAQPQPAAARQIAGYEGKRRRVLIVDDRPKNRDLLRDVLEPLGFRITEAEDGREALVEAARVRPDLVLMDLRMPGMDGLQTTRVIRRANWGVTIPVIAISASAYDLDRKACLEAGCNDFVAKPFRAHELLDLIGRLLALTWLHEESVKAAQPTTKHDATPPAEELVTLLELCKQGDIVALRERATRLRAGDGAYEPFATSLLELATQFRMKAIRELIKSHLDHEPRPAP